MTADFMMKLDVPRDLGGIPKCETPPEYDEQLDDIVSILTDLCALLSKADGVRFVVSGFGQADWNASVSRELSLLLEQLPGVAGNIAKGTAEFSIEFLEQGFWRTLLFEGDADHYSVSCSSGDAWTPSPQQVRVSRRALARMLWALVEEFRRASGAACPALVAHPWFGEWLTSVFVLADAGS